MKLFVNKIKRGRGIRYLLVNEALVHIAANEMTPKHWQHCHVG